MDGWMDAMGSSGRMQQQPLAHPPTEVKANAEGTAQQHDHTGNVHPPKQLAVYPNVKHEQHQFFYNIEGLPMGQPMTAMAASDQQQQQLHYPGQGYAPVQYTYMQPGDMALPQAPGDMPAYSGGYPPGMMMCGALHPQQQQLLSDDALRKRRQRLEKNKESVRNYRKKKREEEGRFKSYVRELEYRVKQLRHQVERLEGDKIQQRMLAESLEIENKQYKSRIDELERSQL